uniref:Protein unc-79 homolog n=1 Tax=Plectus sambesii TaxID=2011161 RepID=A0A914UX21_9BILA
MSIARCPPKTAAKAATAHLSAKIRNLTDFHQRLTLNQQPPSGLEIVNTLRYFQQTLLGFLKDIQNLPAESFRQLSSDVNRSTLYPNLNYSGLFYGVINLLDAYHLIPAGHTAVGHAIINTIKAMYFFLDRESVDQLPYILACLLCYFPTELHADIMQLLCDCILPYTLQGETGDSYATHSIPAVLMLVFQYTKEPSHHTWLLETLMSLRRDVYRDVLAVIAKGTSEARVPAANLLFHYWPLLNPHILDRKPIQYRPHAVGSSPSTSSIGTLGQPPPHVAVDARYERHAWTPSRCQHKDCAAGNGQASVAAGSMGTIRSTPSEQTKSGTTPPPHVDLPPGSAALSIKKCYDPFICADVADTAPPVMLCKSCADKAQEERTKVQLYYICQPMPTTNVHVCQNRGCQSNSRLAVSTCFAQDCIRAHHHVPIRLCQECDDAFHKAKDKAGAEDRNGHICHTRLPCPWTADVVTFHDTIEAIVKLLKETSCQLEANDGEGKRPKWLRQLEAGQSVGRELDDLADEKRMLSRYGIWLMAALCPPTDQAPGDAVGYIMSMLFQWFATTALLPNDAMGSSLEQLKTDFVCDWLNAAVSTHYKVFVECLQPRPPEYAKVGGMWDKLSTRTEQIREGLSKLLAIMPYDVISLATWSTIMPEWLEAICNEVPEKDLSDLKISLCKIFEPDLCPLPFEPEKIFHFIGERLQAGDRLDQQKALDWLHLLSEMDIVMPLDLMLSMLSGAAHRLTEIECMEDVDAHLNASISKKPVVQPAVDKTEQCHRASIARTDSIGEHDGLLDDESVHDVTALTPEESPIRKPLAPGTMMLDAELGDSNAAFYATIMDIILRQIELNDIPAYSGIGSERSQKLLCALSDILRAPWKGSHTCDQPDMDEFVDCNYCQETAIFYEMMMELMERLCPKDDVIISMPKDDDKFDWGEELTETDDAGDSSRGHMSSSVTSPLGIKSRDHTLIDMQESSGLLQAENIPGEVRSLQYQTACVEEAMEEVEFVSMLPNEEVETAMAHATTLTETDVGQATCQVITATLIENLKETPATPRTLGGRGPPGGNFWYTSLGKFRFALEDLPGQLQLIYSAMMNVEEHPDPDVVYFLLHSIKYLCLHGVALDNARREHRGFLIWAQENLLIPKLWKLLRAEYSQIAEVCVPLLMHCLTLPSGEEMFWRSVNDDFTSEDWALRFAAVEKVSLMTQFLGKLVLKTNRVVQGGLANAFCHLIASVHDPSAAVAQRALLYLQAIPMAGLRAMCFCLESQFDTVIIDRPIILHRLHLLATLLPEQSIITWDFFVQRFDTLALESQLHTATTTGETSTFVHDLSHTDPMSDVYQRKITKARTALDSADTVRSIVRCMGDKAMKHQNTINFKAPPQPGDARGTSEKSGDKEERRQSCSCSKRGWHRCSTLSEAAVSCRLKMRKVVLMVKVLNAWQGFRKKLGSLSATSLGSTVSSMLGARGAPPAEGSDTNEPTMEDYLETMSRSASQRGSHVHSDAGGYSGGRLREFTDEESNLCLMLNRVMDTENPERHTVYMTVVLFMMFLSSKKTTLVNPDEKAAAKKQSLVLRHLNTLLGYSNTEKCFSIPPQRLRQSAICNAFLAGLPQVLDANLVLGNQILPIASQLLVYLPSPQRLASDNQAPTYSLWTMDAHARHSWLWSVLLILYKYRFDSPPINETVLNLIRLVLSTLEAQVHQCTALEISSHTPIFQSDDESADQSPDEPWWPRTPTEGLERARSKLRKVFAHVVLLVRVMKVWPKGSHLMLMERLSGSGYSSTDSEADWSGEDGSGRGDKKNRLHVRRRRRRHRSSRGASPIEEGDETLSPLFTFKGDRKNQPSSPGPSGRRTPRTDMTEPPHPMENRLRQQIDEFDRSFAKESMTHVVPTVVVTSGVAHGQLIRPETLGVGGASKARVHEHPQRAQQVTISMEPSAERQLAFASAFEVKSTVIEPQVHMAKVNVAPETVVSLDAQAIESPQTIALEAICEEGEEMSEDGKFKAIDRDGKRGPPAPVPLSAAQKRRQRLNELGRQTSSFTRPPGSSQRHQDAALVLRCTQCNQPLENFDEDTLCMSLICLSTFVHREPSMAAPFLPRLLQTAASIADHVLYPWQSETNVFVPGNSRSVAKQLLRVVIHQLSNNGICLQLFQHHIKDPAIFWKTVATALFDFQEVNAVTVVQILLEDINANWSFRLSRILFNLASYIIYVPNDIYLTVWNTVVGLFDAFFRRYVVERHGNQASVASELNSVITIMNAVLKVQNFSSFKGSVSLVDCFSKWFVLSLQTTPVRLIDVLSICTSCTRAFMRERDKQCVARACVNELVQAIKFKSTLPEENYLVLLHLILQDAGETVAPDIDDMYNTAAADCARPFMLDLVDFIADLHVLNKVKNLGSRGMGFREDTLGGDLKAGFAQYISVEISRASVRDPRTVLRYLPWLLTPPPTEFVDSVTHVRVLSWVLLGALQSTSVACLPIPIESSQHIADQIQFVLAGFAEQSKESVVHMSALFHAFHLCQLWTVYCEQAAATHPESELGFQAMANVMDFWARVTPAILQLLSHSKVLADMVNLHFLNTIQALQECQSAILCQLYPMWQPILTAYHSNIPSHLRMKLDSCENDIKIDEKELNPWLKRVRYKISQVELQTSAASPFYNWFLWGKRDDRCDQESDLDAGVCLLCCESSERCRGRRGARLAVGGLGPIGGLVRVDRPMPTLVQRCVCPFRPWNACLAYNWRNGRLLATRNHHS